MGDVPVGGRFVVSDADALSGSMPPAERFCHGNREEWPVNTSPNWPVPEPGQARVMLLGTYHMDNPGLDTHNVDADDVLTSRRQSELEELVDRLAGWNADEVAVERPKDREDAVRDAYRSYRDGEYAYDEEVDIRSTGPGREDPATECRSEVVQVGFRLADRLAHETVHAVDSHPDPPPGAEGFSWDAPDPDEVPYPVPDFAGVEQEEAERLRESTLTEYHRLTNEANRLQRNHDGMFAGAVPQGADEDYRGARMLGYWYERNLRMVQNLWDAVDPGNRLLLVVGSGHVRVLRHLLDETPMTCPVSPLPLLQPR